jgi:hypothetical protein
MRQIKEFAMPFVHPSPLLRQALLADATTSAACGLLMVLGAGLLAELLRIPTALLLYSGLALFPWTAFLTYLATRERISRAAVWVVIGCNALWAADCLLLIVSGWIEPTAAGHAFIVAQALVVVMYAELQYVGLRRSAAAVA